MDFIGRLFGRRRSADTKPRQEERPVVGERDIRALRDALVPEDPNAPEYNILPTDGTPEQLADALIQSSLPKVFFDEIDLGTDIGQAQLLAMLFSRPRGASIEKDEIIRFVARNGAHIREFTGKTLPAFREAGIATQGGEGLVAFIDYFGTQVRHAAEGHPERIDIKSDRLLWLIYALALQLDAGKLSYDEALGYLCKPEHSERISSLSLVFMLHDYAESIGGATKPSLCYLMLIGEAARLKDFSDAASAAFAVVLRSRDASSGQHLIRYLENQVPYLSKRGKVTAEDSSELARIRSRFNTSVKPEDF
ncbi:MAG TPA: hypothetical protein VFB68_17005 [Xanthobacteraceae bacterium]|nr:hypothetical protein [Xanthobacteraceae bacterium]